MVVGGLAWLGVPCAQWIWLSRGSTGRCLVRPRGRKSLRSVRRANRLVRRLCYLFLGKTYVQARICWLHLSIRALNVKRASIPLCLAKAGVSQHQRRFLDDRAAFKQLTSVLQTVGGQMVLVAFIFSAVCDRAVSFQPIND